MSESTRDMIMRQLENYSAGQLNEARDEMEFGISAIAWDVSQYLSPQHITPQEVDDVIVDIVDGEAVSLYKEAGF